MQLTREHIQAINDMYIAMPVPAIAIELPYGRAYYMHIRPGTVFQGLVLHGILLSLIHI